MGVNRAMSGSWAGGKGSKQRKTQDQKKFDDNWDAIFGKKDKPSAVDDCATVTQEGFAKKSDTVKSSKP
jgi:hypothetical protein